MLTFCAVLLLAGCAPSGPKALLRGERLIGEGKFPEAVETLRLAVQLLPDNAQAWNHLGLAHHGARQPEEAARAYQQALQRNPNLTPAHFNLGVLLLEQNNLPAAVSSLTTFNVLQRDSVEGWLKLATAQLRSRQLEPAERSFQNVLRLRPGLPEALNGLGLIQAQRRRARDAVTLFSTALQRQPNYGPALLNLATMSYSYDRAGSSQRYKSWLSINRNSPQADAVKGLVDQIEAELTAQRAASNQLAATISHLARTLETSNVALERATNSAAPLLVQRGVPQGSAKQSSSSTKREATTPIAPSVAAQPTGSPAQASALPDPTPSAPGPVPPREIIIAEVSSPKPAIDRNSSPPDAAKLPVEDAARIRQEALDLARTTPPTALPLRPAEEKVAEDKRSFVQRLNPVTWFRSKPKPAPTATPLDRTLQRAPQPVATNPAPLLTASIKNADLPPASAPSAAPPPKPVEPAAPPQFPRYRYLSPTAPSPGDPTRAQQALERGLKAHADRQLTGSLAAFRDAVQLDPSLFEAHYNVGLASSELKDWRSSLSAYETALSINSTSAGARFNFALALDRAGYPVDAAAELEKVLADNPANANALLSAGKVYAEELLMPQRATRHFRRLLEIEPQHPQAVAIRRWLVANAAR